MIDFVLTNKHPYIRINTLLWYIMMCMRVLGVAYGYLFHAVVSFIVPA